MSEALPGQEAVPVLEVRELPGEKLRSRLA